MKRINPKKNRNKKIVVICIIATTILASAFAFFYFKDGPSSFVKDKEDNKTDTLTTKDRPVGEVNYSSPDSSQENPALDRNEGSSMATPAHSDTKTIIPVTLSYVGGSPLQVKVLISELLQTGSCSLVLSRSGSAPIQQNVETFPTSSSTTCQGFTIDENLTPGTWNVNVTVTSGDRVGSATKDISL